MSHVTDQVCLCGCNTLMSSSVVDRGWRYLRGHKPTEQPKPRVVETATNPSKMVEFFDRQLAGLETQEKALETKHRGLMETLNTTRTALDQLRAEIQSTKKLRGDVQAHFARRGEVKE